MKICNGIRKINEILYILRVQFMTFNCSDNFIIDYLRFNYFCATFYRGIRYHNIVIVARY